MKGRGNPSIPAPLRSRAALSLLASTGMRTTIILRIAVIAGAAALSIVPARAAETLVKEKTATMDIEAAPEYAKGLAADVRAIEAMVERTGLGNKPQAKERIRYVVVVDRNAAPEGTADVLVVQVKPGADPEDVRAELRDKLAAVILERWTDGAAGRLSSILAGALRNVVTAFEPPAAGGGLPRPKPAGEKLLATVRCGERGENPISLSFLGDPNASAGRVAYAEAVILHATFGDGPDAKLLRAKLRGALGDAAKVDAFWRKQRQKITSDKPPPNGALHVDPKDEARLAAAVMAWVRYGAPSTAGAKAAYAAAVRELVGDRLGFVGEPPPEVLAGDGPVDEPAILAACLAAAAPKAAWLRAGVRRLTDFSGLVFGRFALRVAPEWLSVYDGRRDPERDVSLKEVLEAEPAAFEKSGRSGVHETKAAIFVAYLEREGGAARAAIAADPTIAGIEKALGKPVAEVEASLAVFARKEAEAIRGANRRLPSSD
jgi:hypothetical protein